MRDADEARQLKAHLDEALVLLGNSVEERFSPGLAAALGRTWFKSVRPKQGSFARYDFVSYADCLLGETELTREHRDLFRQVAGVPWAAYGRELAAAKHARNEITHPNQIFNRHSATQLMGALAGIAQALELSSAQALMATADAMRAGDFIRVSRIEPAHEGERAVVREIEAQLAREREEKAAYAERVRDADERLATQEAALALARERGHREVELLRSANAALESAEYARADQARLERESRAHEQAAREANERAATSAREAKAAKDERDRLVREVAASQTRISELETQTASRLGPRVVADEASLDALQDRVVALQVAAQFDLAQIVRSGGDDASRRAAAQRVRIVEASPPVLSVAGAGRASHSIRPGQKWPFGAGERSYSLRPRSRDVYEYETDTWLSDVIGKANAHEVVERLAKHRPEGGTIRVDSDGDVSSQRKTGGGRFYLGRVEPDEWFPDVIEIGLPVPEAAPPAARQLGGEVEQLHEAARSPVGAPPPWMGLPAGEADVGAAHQVPSPPRQARPAVRHAAARQAAASAGPRPGWDWMSPKGALALLLSDAGALTLLPTGFPVADLIGEETAFRHAVSFLEVMPEGGTVWIDEEGQVCGCATSGPVYLGQLPPAAVSSSRWLIDSDRQDLVRVDGTRLSDLLGHSAAQVVVARLHAEKPGGTEVWLDPTGTWWIESPSGPRELGSLVGSGIRSAEGFVRLAGNRRKITAGQATTIVRAAQAAHCSFFVGPPGSWDLTPIATPELTGMSFPGGGQLLRVEARGEGCLEGLGPFLKEMAAALGGKCLGQQAPQMPLLWWPLSHTDSAHWVVLLPRRRNGFAGYAFDDIALPREVALEIVRDGRTCDVIHDKQALRALDLPDGGLITIRGKGPSAGIAVSLVRERLLTTRTARATADLLPAAAHIHEPLAKHVRLACEGADATVTVGRDGIGMADATRGEELSRLKLHEGGRVQITVAADACELILGRVCQILRAPGDHQAKLDSEREKEAARERQIRRLKAAEMAERRRNGLA